MELRRIVGDRNSVAFADSVQRSLMFRSGSLLMSIPVNPHRTDTKGRWACPRRDEIRQFRDPRFLSLILPAGRHRKPFAMGVHAHHPDVSSPPFTTMCLDFSPNSRRLVAADWWSKVRMWDVETRQTVATFEGSVVAFSPDGTTLAVGGEAHLASLVLPEAGRVRLYRAPPLSEFSS